MSSSSMCRGQVCQRCGERVDGSGVAPAADLVRAQVEVMLERLEEQEAVGTQIADVEDQLVLDVREVGRLGLQKFLDDQAAGETRREVTGSDAVTRTRVEHGHTRPLRSVFGEVTVTRPDNLRTGVGGVWSSRQAGAWLASQ